LNQVLSASCVAWYLVKEPFLRQVTTTVEMRSATEKLRNLSHLMTFCSQSTSCFVLFVSSEHIQRTWSFAFLHISFPMLLKRCKGNLVLRVSLHWNL